MRSSISPDDSGDDVRDAYLDMSAEEGFPRPVEELLARLGLDLKDHSTVAAALTHPSFWGEYAIPEEKRLARSYERLEFLGDSVIALTICTFLFQRYPEYHQGKLSKIKGHLVSKDVLIRVAESLDLGEYMRVGRGLAGTISQHTGFEVDGFEALVGAIFLEKGFVAASEFALKSLAPEIEKVSTPDDLQDHKTALQEIVQKRYKSLPVYKLAAQAGPEHRKRFTVEVFINGRPMGTGDGSSKKEAEINAAHAALDKITDEDGD